MTNLGWLVKEIGIPLATAIAGFYGALIVFRRNNRRSLIDKWKASLLDSSLYFDYTDEQRERQSFTVEFDENGMVNPETSFDRVIRLSSFASLKPHMSKDALNRLNKFSGYEKDDANIPRRVATIILGATENPVRELIAKEIHRLEKRWWLV